MLHGLVGFLGLELELALTAPEFLVPVPPMTQVLHRPLDFLGLELELGLTAPELLAPVLNQVLA